MILTQVKHSRHTLYDRNLASTSGSPLLGALPAVDFLSFQAKAEQFPSQTEAPHKAQQHSQGLWINKSIEERKEEFYF